MTNPAPLETPQKKRHWKSYTIAAASFLLIGALCLGYWLIWGQFRESTDDAYVTGNQISITPQVAGIVTTILIDNTQMVEENQLLVQLDEHDFLIAFERAKALLADQVRSVAQLFLKVEELKAKEQVAEAALVRAALDYEHRAELVQDVSVSIEEFEHSETTLASSEAFLKEVIKELEAALAEVEGTTIPTHPKVELAKAAVRESFLALHRCKVVAPARGIITQRAAQVGQWVNAQDPLMSLVPLDEIWVDANFREVSLKHLRIGQPIELVSDMYGSDFKFHGQMVGFNPGSGSVFSILPPQNATGNWIKIVQRVPVRISLCADELTTHPLLLGLSMTVYADTHNRDGQRLPFVTESRPIYETSAYARELEGVEELIQQIIQDNYTIYEKQL